MGLPSKEVNIKLIPEKLLDSNRGVSTTEEKIGLTKEEFLNNLLNFSTYFTSLPLKPHKNT